MQTAVVRAADCPELDLKSVGEFERSSAQIWEGPREWSCGRDRKDIVPHRDFPFDYQL